MSISAALSSQILETLSRHVFHNRRVTDVLHKGPEIQSRHGSPRAGYSFCLFRNLVPDEVEDEEPARGYLNKDLSRHPQPETL